MAGAERSIGPATRASPVIEWRPPKLIAIHSQSALLLACFPPVLRRLEPIVPCYPKKY